MFKIFNLENYIFYWFFGLQNISSLIEKNKEGQQNSSKRIPNTTLSYHEKNLEENFSFSSFNFLIPDF